MEKTIEFKEGISVWLKTQSPEMIIHKVFNVTKECTCIWFKGTTKYEQNFSFTVLTNIKPNSGLFYSIETVL